jgi:hypothetical protein
VRLGAAVLGASESVSCSQQTRDNVLIPNVKLAVSWYVTVCGLLNKGGCLKKVDASMFKNENENLVLRTNFNLLAPEFYI